jgi:TPR repeat protein
MKLSMRILKRLLLAVSMCCLVATANAASFDDANAARLDANAARLDAANTYLSGDLEKAVKLYLPLAEQGDANAQYMLGSIYFTGKKVQQDLQVALKWLRMSAAQGNSNAQSLLKNEFMVRAAQDSQYQQFGSPSKTPSPATANAAPMDDAIDAYNRGDYAQALKIFRQLAAQGDASAQYRFGQMYREGQGVTQNYQEALKWYRLAAAQGIAEAQNNIGWMYHKGYGVTQDHQEALKWYRLAADQGNASAQYNIGYMYGNGQGVTQNYQEALNWFRLAAAQGDATAIENLKRPEMVAAALNSPAEKPQRMANKPAGKSSPPQLTFSSSTPNSDGSIELSGRVTSNSKISEVLINGGALEVSLAKDGSFKLTRLLPMGSTTYRLSATDEFGSKTDATVTVERAATEYIEQVTLLDPRKMKAKGNQNAVALIIGVETYSNLPKAQYAGSDANHFYNYANHSLGVPPNKIKLLTDSKASRLELLKAMKSWMRTEVNGKTDVYIFFAGHGLASTDGSKTYLLPADGDRDLLDETSILRDDLIASAKGAKTITMFLDTCYSGGTRTNEVLLTDARPIAIVPDMKALPSNVTVLAAASGAQLSSTYEAAQQGLFSYWLMKGMEGDADTNKDKKITAGELHDYVSRQVGPMAQRRNRQQDPQLMGDSTRVLVSY